MTATDISMIIIDKKTKYMIENRDVEPNNLKISFDYFREIQNAYQPFYTRDETKIETIFGLTLTITDEEDCIEVEYKENPKLCSFFENRVCDSNCMAYKIVVQKDTNEEYFYCMRLEEREKEYLNIE